MKLQPIQPIQPRDVGIDAGEDRLGDDVKKGRERLNSSPEDETRSGSYGPPVANRNIVAFIILLGIFVMAASLLEIIMIYRTRAAGGSLPRYLGWPILIMGGIFHGIYALGAPLIVYYSSRELKEPAEFRATVSMLWLILAVMLVINLYSIGQINITTITTTGIVLPGLILGIFFGSRMKFQMLPFKVLIYALLFIAGLLLLLQP